MISQILIGLYHCRRAKVLRGVSWANRFPPPFNGTNGAETDQGVELVGPDGLALQAVLVAWKPDDGGGHLQGCPPFISQGWNWVRRYLG